MSGHYKRLLAGLGITLAVVSLYVVAATLLYGRDCIMLFHKDRLEDKEKRKRRKTGRVEFSRCKNKRDAGEIIIFCVINSILILFVQSFKSLKLIACLKNVLLYPICFTKIPFGPKVL